jgi:hypothetical protein
MPWDGVLGVSYTYVNGDAEAGRDPAMALRLPRRQLVQERGHEMATDQ